MVRTCLSVMLASTKSKLPYLLLLSCYSKRRSLAPSQLLKKRDKNETTSPVSV